MGEVVLVTGMSGAGRTTCLKILEDLDFEAVDNLPVNLLGRLLRRDELNPERLAIGIDCRTRGFSAGMLLDTLGELRCTTGTVPRLLFLECDDEVLRRRFSETRRRHPLGEIAAVADALAAERSLMAPLKAAADLVITAEGAIDFQTPRGKVPAEIARRARLAGVPVLGLAGSLGRGAPAVHDIGIDAIASILTVPMPLEEAVEQGEELLRDAAERTMRLVLLGSAMSARAA